MQVNISVIIAATTLMSLALTGTANGKIFTRCEIKKALEKNKVSSSFISNWVCLAESESGRDSSKITQKILYESFGIFQIRGNEWCGRNGVVAGLCRTRCENFVDDKLDDDIQCAMKIFETCGFKNWPGWVEKCKLKTLPNLLSC